jgi:hypothetical protein
MPRRFCSHRPHMGYSTRLTAGHLTGWEGSLWTKVQAALCSFDGPAGGPGGVSCAIDVDPLELDAFAERDAKVVGTHASFGMKSDAHPASRH